MDAEGRKFGTNTEADGRFHSKWLNMMYPRLYLARNLLREDGVIFISIDDHEVAALRAILLMRSSGKRTSLRNARLAEAILPATISAMSSATRTTI